MKDFSSTMQSKVKEKPQCSEKKTKTNPLGWVQIRATVRALTDSDISRFKTIFSGEAQNKALSYYLILHQEAERKWLTECVVLGLAEWSAKYFTV